MGKSVNMGRYLPKRSYSNEISFTTLKYDFSLKVMIPAFIRLHSLQLIEKEMTK